MGLLLRCDLGSAVPASQTSIIPEGAFGSPPRRPSCPAGLPSWKLFAGLVVSLAGPHRPKNGNTHLIHARLF